MFIVSNKNMHFLKLNNYAMGVTATLLRISCRHIQDQINQIRHKYELNEYESIEDLMTDLDGLEMYLREICEGEKSRVKILEKLEECNDTIFINGFKL